MKLVQADGLTWSVGGADTDDHLALGGHEVALGPILESMASPDKAYINVGAHVGTWALRLAKKFNIVYAVEANPYTFGKLYNNIALNHLEDSVFPVEAAVWDKAGEKLYLVDAQGKATGGSTRLDEKQEGGSVVTRTLDQLFENSVVPIGLISMDVEGAEARVLAGAEKVIMKHRPNLLIELHEGHPGTAPDLREQVYALLLKYNYYWSSLKVSPPEEHLRCLPNDGIVALEPEKVTFEERPSSLIRKKM